MKDDLKKVVDRASQQVAELTDDRKASLRALPDAFEQQSGLIQKALELVANARAVKQSWDDLQDSRDLNAIPDMLSEISGLTRQIDDVFDPEWLDESQDVAAAILKREFEDTEDAVSAALSEFLDSTEATTAIVNAESYYADIQTGIGIVKEVRRILGIGTIQVASVAPDVPEAFEIDIEDLRDTYLDLRRVAGSVGDTITVRTRLKKPGVNPIESVASFELTHYGHHARIVPSVVLVRPDEIASGEDDFGFAPAVGWMHYYNPRPENDGWFANIARPLQLSAGLHAIFLNFDNSSGIGLGGTLSFWNDRLQFGAGYNLSASSSDEGEVYYFVGSDLIGLLQTVGIGN
jgi:hypothetical protein